MKECWITSVTRVFDSQIRKDKGCVKEINLLEVDCPLLCGWKNLLVKLEVHVGSLSCVYHLRNPLKCCCHLYFYKLWWDFTRDPTLQVNVIFEM